MIGGNDSTPWTPSIPIPLLLIKFFDLLVYYTTLWQLISTVKALVEITEHLGKKNWKKKKISQKKKIGKKDWNFNMDPCANNDQI